MEEEQEKELTAVTPAPEDNPNGVIAELPLEAEETTGEADSDAASLEGRAEEDVLEPVDAREEQEQAQTAETPASQDEPNGVIAEPQPGAEETTGEAYSDVARREDGVATDSDRDVPVEIPAESAPQSAPTDVSSDSEASDAPDDAESFTADEILMGMEQPAQVGETNEAELLAILEAIVYITDEPLSAKQIADALQKPLEYVRSLLDKLVDEFSKAHHGLTVKEVAGGYKITTKPEHHEAVRAFVKNLNPPLKLSLAALETLAVIAYKQPITAPEIMEIRGVQGAGVLKTLLDRKLITSAGRKNVVGKPILYKTTKEFLVQFGLRDLNELPTLKEFEDLRRFAFSETEDAPIDTPTPEREAAEVTHE
jgi:segregation and condensation protein B